MLFKRVVVILILSAAVVSPLSAASDSISKVFNYPNPYKPSEGGTTSICFLYNNQTGGIITTLNYYVYIYNILGHRLYVRYRSAANVAVDEHPIEFTWNGRTDKGGKVPPGIYYIRIVTAGGGANGQTISKYGKMMVK